MYRGAPVSNEYSVFRFHGVLQILYIYFFNSFFVYFNTKWVVKEVHLIIKYHDNSLMKALIDLFPELNLQVHRFPTPCMFFYFYLFCILNKMMLMIFCKNSYFTNSLSQDAFFYTLNNLSLI